MIRPAKEEDLPALLEIANDAILNSTAIYEYEPWTLRQMSNWFKTRINNGFPIIVLEDKNEVKGYATFGAFRPREAYRFSVEHSIYVHKKFRGSGLGASLMKELITLAEQHGAHSMIGVIDATNEKSIAFHKQHAFQEVGRLREVGHKFGTWLDVALLQRML